VEAFSEALIQWQPLLVVFFICLLFPLIVEHGFFILFLDCLLSEAVYIVDAHFSLALNLFLFAWWQLFNDYGCTVHPTHDVLNVVVQFKFGLWVRAFNETSLPVRELAHFVIAPNEERSVVEGSHAETTTTH